jgi:hypothetical protein
MDPKNFLKKEQFPIGRDTYAFIAFMTTEGNSLTLQQLDLFFFLTLGAIIIRIFNSL